MAVYNDLCDETTDRLGHIQSVHGNAGVWQYAWMIEQTKREMEASRVALPAPKQRHPVNWLGWATFAAFIAFGLISLLR